MQFFDLDILFSIKHSTAERWHPHVVLLFFKGLGPFSATNPLTFFVRIFTKLTFQSNTTSYRLNQSVKQVGRLCYYQD